MIHSFRLAPLVVLALLLAPSVHADRILFRDGTELTGDILWRRAGRLSLRLPDGSIRLVEESRVQRLICDGDVLEVFEQRRRVADLLGVEDRPEAYLDLSLWAAEHGVLIDLAEGLLQEAVRLDPDLADLTDYHLVRLAIETEQFDLAAERAKETLERNPNHERVMALVATGQKEAVIHLTDRLAPVLDAYRKRRYERVLALGRDLLGSLSSAEAEALDQEFHDRSGMPLSSILIDSRFQMRCKAQRCRSGIIQCPYCQGTGRKKKFRRQVKGQNGMVQNEAVYTVWCGHCDGRIHYSCSSCSGTGFDLGSPTEFERSDLIQTLLRLVEENRESFEKVVEGIRSADSDHRVRVLDSYSALAMLRRAQFFLETVVELEPGLGSPAGGNLTVQLQQLRDLSSTFLSGLSTTYLEQADRIYQEAMDLEVSAGSSRISNLPSRVLKLQESLSLAEESRKYVVELMENDPSSRGFLMGNYQRRLELIDEFIERNRKALLLLRKIEDSPGQAAKILGWNPGEQSSLPEGMGR